jgi:NhaP-type Na+/H+ or K+/H+ antiporter
MELYKPLLQLIWAGAAGALSQLVSERLRQPSIFFLLLSGLVMGPHGMGILSPFAFRDYLPLLVEASVVVIVFEGAMTLRTDQWGHISSAVKRLVTIGGLLTMGLSAVAVRYTVGAGWELCFIFGALMSVTGPTVIGPIVKRVRPKKNVGAILMWESIVLDPIGAVAAVIALEIAIGGEGRFLMPLLNFPARLAVGVAIGSAAAWSARSLLRVRNLAGLDTRINAALAFALLCYGLSEVVVHHSGLFAVVAMGIILGNSDFPDRDTILEFKGTLTSFLLSVVFVLLAANLNIFNIHALGWNAVIVAAAVILVIRPINVAFSTRRSGLSVREKVFLSWIAPRGIVAGSLASLFTITLQGEGYREAENLEALVFLVIGTTVTLQGLTAGITARWLGVVEARKNGFLIVAAHHLAQGIAQWLRTKFVEVILVDTDWFDVREAREKGIEAYRGSILDEGLFDRIDTGAIGHLLAMTTNDEVNALSCQVARRVLQTTSCFRPPANQATSRLLSEAGGRHWLEGAGGIEAVLDGLKRGTIELKPVSLPEPSGDDKKTYLSEEGRVWPLFRERDGVPVPVAEDDILKAGEPVLALVSKG